MRPPNDSAAQPPRFSAVGCSGGLGRLYIHGLFCERSFHDLCLS